MINTIQTGTISSRVEHLGSSPEPGEGRVPAVNIVAPQNQGEPGREWAPGTIRDYDAARKVEKALAYMLAHPHQPVRISALGALSGVSTSYFYHLFKLATGSTPNDFLIRARMRRACKLLLNPALSVKEIAHLLGYNDPLYFSRVFKSVSGLPPRSYRSLMMERECATPRGVMTPSATWTFGTILNRTREGSPTAEPTLKDREP